jgi:surfeit locus 1 family protein
VTSRFRRLIGPALMTVAMLIVLLGLGTWQVHRLAWKEAILAQIAHAESAPPVALPAAPSPFIKVSVAGRLLAGKAAVFGADVRDTATGPALGALLIEPLQRDGAATILVDRGWVPLKGTKPVATPEGITQVTGYVHPGDTPGWFAAHDDIQGRHFYTLDPAVIGAALGLDHVAPFVLIALGAPPPEGLPIPAEHLPRPPNNHLQYAITWYGLAAALVVIFTVWARKAVRT